MSCLTQDEVKARDKVWLELVKLGKRMQDRRIEEPPDLSNVAPHLVGRRR